METAGILPDTPISERRIKDALNKKIKAEDEADLEAKRSAFEEHFKPPTGRKQHSRTAVLLLYWDKNDINVAPEVEDLGTAFKEKYHFEVDTFKILSKECPGPELQLQRSLTEFLYAHASPNTLYIIYYAGHGWIKNGDDDNEEFKLGAQATTEALKSRQENELVWINAEQVLHKQPADILLIFDCCYAGYLNKYRGAQTFEFLGACNAQERTFGPGPKSFTESLIWALRELAEDEQGFDTRTLLSKIKKYETFPNESLTPVLFTRDYRSTAHIWIESLPSGESSTSRQLDEEQALKHSADTITNPEWLQFSFVFNRPQKLKDIKNLAGSLTDFAANHTSHGLERISLQGKSPDPRLGWPWIAQWLYQVRRKSFSGQRPHITATADISILESPPLETPVEVAHHMQQDDTKIQAPITPISGADSGPSEDGSDLEPMRKRLHHLVDGIEIKGAEIQHPKKQCSRGK